jgi:hypothetical protein
MDSSKMTKFEYLYAHIVASSVGVAIPVFASEYNLAVHGVPQMMMPFCVQP